MLANFTGTNTSLLAGELSSNFSTLELPSPISLIDSIVHFFNRLCNYASQPQWTVQALFLFLSSKDL